MCSCHCFPDFNLAYLQRHGFNTPLLFRDKTGLGLRVPSPNFSVNDVRMCVGEYFYVISASVILVGICVLSLLIIYINFRVTAGAGCNGCEHAKKCGNVDERMAAVL